MTADKKLAADLRKLRDLGAQLAAKGNELMKLGVEVQRLVDSVRCGLEPPKYFVTGGSVPLDGNLQPGKIVFTEE